MGVELTQQRQDQGVATIAEPTVDAKWVQRSIARFGIADATNGLPTSRDGVRAAVRCGVDCWLGRGCDSTTSRWLEAVTLQSIHVGSETREGAIAGLKETLLSPEYMVNWASELRQ